MRKKYAYWIGIINCLLLPCCQPATSSETPEQTPDPVVPVTVANISTGPMEDFVMLNANSVFRQKWIVRSNLNGYLQKSNASLNKMVALGQPLFVVKTKEAMSIGNTISLLDSSFKFSGVNTIHSNGSGFISEINHQAGDYVQDGEQLAIITDTRSFVFILNLPYELRPYLDGKTSLPVILPDSEKLEGTIAGSLPAVDSIAQTQQVILQVKSTHPIPENLLAKVKLVKKANPAAISVPRAAVLSDETQSSFWVMRLLNDSTAVKTAITKGIQTNDLIEIVSPPLSTSEKILVTGNYSLPDTARVKVVTTSKQD